MRYFKLATYTGEGEYEAIESLIDEPTFRQYQKAFLEGKDFLVLENKIIKRSMIKHILPADDIVREYTAMGLTLKQIGLRELPKLSEGEKSEELGEGMKRINEIKAKSSFGQKMVDDETYTSIQEEVAGKERRGF